jgi:hypothetical protein
MIIKLCLMLDGLDQLFCHSIGMCKMHTGNALVLVTIVCMVPQNFATFLLLCQLVQPGLDYFFFAKTLLMWQTHGYTTSNSGYEAICIVEIDSISKL